MKIIVETKEENKEREETIIVRRGVLRTSPKIILEIRGTTYYLDLYVFEGLL